MKKTIVLLVLLVLIVPIVSALNYTVVQDNADDITIDGNTTAVVDATPLTDRGWVSEAGGNTYRQYKEFQKTEGQSLWIVGLDGSATQRVGFSIVGRNLTLNTMLFYDSNTQHHEFGFKGGGDANYCVWNDLGVISDTRIYYGTSGDLLGFNPIQNYNYSVNITLAWNGTATVCSILFNDTRSWNFTVPNSNVSSIYFQVDASCEDIYFDEVTITNGTWWGGKTADAPPPPDTSAPALTIEHPANNSYTVQYNINGTTSDDEGVDVTWINDTRWENDGTDEAFDFINNTEVADGNYTVNITVNDTSNNQNTTLLNFVIDTVAPAWLINSIETDNSSLFYNSVVNITLDDSVVDVNLDNATINITNTSLSWVNTSIAINDTLNFTQIVDISTWTDGIYNITYYGIDKAGNTQTISYSFEIATNTPPFIAGLNVMHDNITKRETQYIDFVSIDDYDDDPLTLVCCRDLFDTCIPTLANTILTGGNRINQTNYTIINGSYTVGIEPYDEYIRCRVYGDIAYSNTVSNSYSIISSITDPIIYNEYFRYDDDISEHGWIVSPYNESIIPTSNYTLYLDQTKLITLTKYINRTKTPLVTIRFDLNITNGTDPVGFGVYRWDVNEPYKLIPETILSLLFFNQKIYYKNLSIGTYNYSLNYEYELNMYFKTTTEFYNNVSKEIETLGHDTFILQQDGEVLKYNNYLYTNTTKYDEYYFDRLVWYKASDVNMTLDTIIVYEGDNLVYNNIFEVLNPANETGYMETFGGFYETQSYDFDCVRYPKCCEWVTRADGTTEQVASKTWCVLGTIAKGWAYGSGNKKGLIYHIENNLFGFFLILFVIVIAYPTYIALTKRHTK